MVAGKKTDYYRTNINIYFFKLFPETGAHWSSQERYVITTDTGLEVKETLLSYILWGEGY